MKALLALAFLLSAPPSNGLPATMPVADVRAGMKCVGRTVYSGTEIVDFQCEILGVLPGAWGPGEDVIIARLVGANADRYGIAAGMSGSPVFVDGKLIGALSLAYGSFQREPIAGITPIDSMLRVRGSQGWPGASRGAAPAGALPRSGAMELLPIRTPLVMSGLAPELIDVSRSLLEPLGFVVSAGGGTSRAVAAALDSAPDRAAAAGLVPGAAVSGMLVQGDVNIAATGTVTWRENDSVVAFGHSFLLYGDVELPMGAAEIVATVPSDNLSFKLGKTNAVVGAVTRDNRTAIAGTIGATARMIPVTVKLPEGTIPREIRFGVFRNKVLTAPMMTLGVMNGLVGNAAYDAEGTVRLEGKIVVDGYPDIALSRTYFDPGAQGGGVPAIAGELASILQKLFDNDLAAAQVNSVALDLSVEKGRRESRIDSAWAERTTVKPGETIGVRVRMRPFRGPAEVREIRMKIPIGTPAGPLQVQIGDARYFETKDRVTPALHRPDDFAALIHGFNARRAEDTLYVRLLRTTQGAIVRGTALPSLPPSALAVVRGADKSAGGADALPDATLDEVRMPLGARVTGNAELTITVVP